MKHSEFLLEKENIRKFLDKYSNIIPDKNDFQKFNEKIKNNKYLDQILWFVDTHKKDIEKLDEIQWKQLYLITNSIMLFKPSFELSKDDESSGFISIYGGFDSSGLYLKYPPSNKTDFNETNYEKYYNSQNPSDCRDENLDIPKYFYFKCRPWYKETMELSKKENVNIVISYPYPFFSSIKMVGITVCIKFDIYLFNEKDEEKKDIFTLCIDMSLSNLISVFDYMNNMINGYFFVLRYDSEKPIYYPKIENFGDLKNLIKYEFDQQSSYYIDELYNYQMTHKKRFNTKYPYEINPTEKNDTVEIVKKNGKKMNYTIWPISLNIGENEAESKFFFLKLYFIKL
jgi:hypothetical protein